MNDKDFDQLFKSKLNQYEADYSGDVWAKVAAEIQPPAKRRFIVGWNQKQVWMAASLLLVAALGVFAYLHNNQKESLTTSTKPKSTSTQSVNTIAESAKATTPNNHSSQLNETSKVQPKVGEEHTPETTSVVRTSSAVELGTISGQKTAALKKDNQLIDKKENSIPKSAIAQQTKSVANHSTISKPNAVTGNKILENNNIQAPEQSLLPTATKGNKQLTNSTIETIKPAENEFAHLGKQPIAQIGKQLEFASKTSSINVSKNSSILFPSEIKAKPIKANRNISIDVFASHNTVALSKHSNGASAAYLRKLDSAEHMLTGYTTGIRISKNITDKLSLTAGIQFTQHNQQFVQRAENVKQTTQVVTTRSYINEQGANTVLYDTSLLTQIGSTSKSTVNKFQSIELPVMLGYQIVQSGLWSLQVQAGTVVQLINQYSGSTYDAGGNIIDLSNYKGASVYSNNFNLHLVAGIGLYKKVGAFTSFFAEPTFRYSLGRTTAINLGYANKVQITGLQFGARVQINNRPKSSISLL